MTAGGRQLAFIVGHYKSGTTWLANMLSLHPEVRGLRETQIFRYAFAGKGLEACTRVLYSGVSWAGGGSGSLLRHRVGGWLRPLRRRGQASLRWTERPTTLLDLGVRDQARLRRLLSECESAPEYCRRFFAFMVDRLAPPSLLLEKSVTGIHFLPQIKRVFPQCKLLAIHRDGRDVVVSDRYHRLNQYGRQWSFEASVLEWRKAMETQRTQGEELGLFAVSYESLLQAPCETLCRILGFLELPQEPEVVRDMLRRSSFEFVTGRRVGQEDRSSFYRKGGSGGWRDELSAEQKARFSELAGELLVALGYEDDPGWEQWPDPRASS